MENQDGKIVRKALRFTGFVQGVGFRWRAQQAASALGVTGWVRNDYDGAVSMELQGTQQQIDEVILAVERGIYVMIENMDCKTIPVHSDERFFCVMED